MKIKWSQAPRLRTATPAHMASYSEQPQQHKFGAPETTYQV